MRIEKLIKQLEAIKAKHGNLHVTTSDGWGYTADVGGAELLTMEKNLGFLRYKEGTKLVYLFTGKPKKK